MLIMILYLLEYYINQILIEYSDDLEHLLKIHAEECESLGILHLSSYEKFNRRRSKFELFHMKIE